MKTNPPGIIASDRMVRLTATPSAFNVDIFALPFPGAPAPRRDPGIARKSPAAPVHPTPTMLAQPARGACDGDHKCRKIVAAEGLRGDGEHPAGIAGAG